MMRVTAGYGRLALALACALGAALPGRVWGQTAAIDGWGAFTSMSEINQILVHGGGVWSATVGGVLHFDQAARTYQRYTRLDGLAGNKVLSLTADAAGDLWFGTDQQG